MDPAAEGTVYPPASFVVDADRVAAFRAAVGADTGIPPTFLTAAEFLVFPLVIRDPALALDFSRVVHGSQEYVVARPVREGETLRVQARIESAKVRAGSGFLTIATEMCDEDGELVATARATMIERASDR
jgi:hypothetical protein